jgi:hypothetical protein
VIGWAARRRPTSSAMKANPGQARHALSHRSRNTSRCCRLSGRSRGALSGWPSVHWPIVIDCPPRCIARVLVLCVQAVLLLLTPKRFLIAIARRASARFWSNGLQHYTAQEVVNACDNTIAYTRLARRSRITICITGSWPWRRAIKPATRTWTLRRCQPARFLPTTSSGVIRLPSPIDRRRQLSCRPLVFLSELSLRAVAAAQLPVAKRPAALPQAAPVAAAQASCCRLH